MKRQLGLLVLPALALACMLSVTEPTYAQRGGRGGGGRSYSGGRSYGGGRGYSGYNNGYRGGYYGGGWGTGLGIGIGLGYAGYGGYGGGYYNGGYYSPYNSYASPFYSSDYSYSVPAYTDAAISGSYQSLYPSSGAIQQSLDTATSIHIRVPASAQVMFDGTQTTQTGTDRMFTTGPLDPSKQYSYQITAQWNENGNDRRESRTVRIIPGQSVDVDFMRAAPLPQPKSITVAQ